MTRAPSLHESSLSKSEQPASSTLVERLIDPRFIGQEEMRSEAAARITELEERSEAQKAQVKWGSETIERLQSQLERVRAETWQPIETAPTDDLDPPIVLLWVEGGGSQGRGSIAFGRCYKSHDGSVRGVPSDYYGFITTHWRPLPAPPQQKTEGV